MSSVSVPRVVLSPSFPRVDLSACPRRSQAELAARGLLLPPKPGTPNPGPDSGTHAAASGGNNSRAASTGENVCDQKIEASQNSRPAAVGADVSEKSRVRSDGGECLPAGEAAAETVVAEGDGNGNSPSDCNEGDYREVEWSVEVARVVRVRRLSRRLVFLDVEIMTVGDSNVRDTTNMEQLPFQQQQQQQQQEEQHLYERGLSASTVNDVSSAVVDVSGTLEVALKHPTCPDVRANSRHAHIGRLVSLRGPLVDLQPARACIKASHSEDAKVPASFRMPLFFASSLTPLPAARPALAGSTYITLPDISSLPSPTSPHPLSAALHLPPTLATLPPLPPSAPPLFSLSSVAGAGGEATTSAAAAAATTKSALLAAPRQELETSPTPATAPAAPSPLPAAAAPSTTVSSPPQSKKALRRAYLSGAIWKPQSIQKEFSAADHSWASAGYSCFIGLHPDEVTGDIVFAAARAKIPFAVVPCCVFPGRFSARRVAVGGQMKKVETHGDLVEYLSAMCRYFGGCPKVDWLNFSGKNMVLYCMEYT
ncbi:hypothetical protein CLOM_g11060 [Closterium sp. NIES-68]|nr:hypothetical protein CLOM_g11060 [Closterium sp. NIES-68]GJP60157.1 hypothetical protein CLOP_g17291 [Closterium sp. NIES-67]